MQKRSNQEDHDHRSSPSVHFILQTLEQRIQVGHYAVGQRLPTERALAAEFEVSRTTVRLALDELARRGLLERASGCRPLVCRPHVRNLPVVAADRRADGRHVALWISAAPGDSGAHSTLQGVQLELSRMGSPLIMASPPNQEGLEGAIRAEAEFLSRLAREGHCAGVILWYLGGEQNRSHVEALRATGVPMIFVDREPPQGFAADYVGIDNERAAYRVVQHLIACGHRRIAHVTNIERADTVRQRLTGYRRALQEADIPYHPGLIHTGDFMEADADSTGRARNELMHKILQSPQPPTALFAVNDYYALSLISSLRASDVKVPEDIAVAGFDDLERWIPGNSVLTTISQPFEQMGKEAVRLLSQRLITGGNGGYRRLILEAPLVIRHSTVVTDNPGFTGVVAAAPRRITEFP